MDRRKQQEKDFHNISTSDNRRVAVSKYYSVVRRSRDFYLNNLLGFCENKRVLECGSGKGDISCQIAKHGGIVTGIDISEVRLEKARDTAIREGVAGKTRFEIMDVESLAYETDSFDIVCGTGILHHLNLDRAFAELSRVLTPSGKAVFLEPLGHNPLINLFRKLTPHLRTKDEHPLLTKDLRLAEGYFQEVAPNHFHLFSICAVPFRNSFAFEAILDVFDRLDEMTFASLAFMRPLSWFVVIQLSKPIKEHSGRIEHK